MSDLYLIKNGRILDPSNDRNEISDLFIADGMLLPVPEKPTKDTIVINAEGCTVCPGLIDLHVHFREPGGEDAETIETGSMAAAAGGFTTVVTMPNTNPPTDSAQRISDIIEKAAKLKTVNILPSGCITSGRLGNSTANLAAMKNAGAVAFTDDGSTVHNDSVMRNAMNSASELNVPVMDHAMHAQLAGAGVLRKHPLVSAAVLPGIPADAEIEIVKRDIAMAEQTGCAVHIQHLSTKEAVQLIRNARLRGIRISTEATPHHLDLTVDDIDFSNTNFKMNPPLGTREDQAALVEGIIDGTIEAFATDHAPHTHEKKSSGMINAPFGIIGLETAVGVTYTRMVKNGALPVIDWLARWTTGPAGILGISIPTLKEGHTADLTILDLKTQWTVNPDEFASKSTNTPFAGRTLTGRALYTFCNGHITHQAQVITP